MITGWFGVYGEPNIGLKIARSSGTVTDIDAWVDTGFTNELTLNAEIILAFELQRLDTIDIRLADGTIRSCNTYRARANWDGDWRKILVEEADYALVGIGLMQGYQLSIDFEQGGLVGLQAIC
jgi:predicted aspartyl protease